MLSIWPTRLRKRPFWANKHVCHMVYLQQANLSQRTKASPGPRLTRQSISQYEIAGSKLGRFDRKVDTLRIDAMGNMSQYQASVRDLLLSTKMHVRDLVTLSPDALRNSHERLTPCILPRGDVIVVVLHPLRLLISRDYCLAFEPSDPTVQTIVKDLSSSARIKHFEGMHNPDNPNAVDFELVILEQVLKSFCLQFQRITSLLALLVESSLKGLMDAAAGGLPEDDLYELVPLKDGLAVTQNNVQEVVDILVDLLHSDEDMVEMLLSEKARQSGIRCLDISLHSEVELLLENYHRQLAIAIQQLRMLRARVQSVQEIFALNVDLYRNRVLRMDLLLMMVSTSLAPCAVIASYLGMNVVNGLEENTAAFGFLVGGSLGLGLAIFAGARTMMRGQGKHGIRQDLDRMTAYQSIFKHIRSIADVIHTTDVPSADHNMEADSNLRERLRKLLSDARQTSVKHTEVDILAELVQNSADTLRKYKVHSNIEEFQREFIDVLKVEDDDTVNSGVKGDTTSEMQSRRATKSDKNDGEADDPIPPSPSAASAAKAGDAPEKGRQG